MYRMERANTHFQIVETETDRVVFQSKTEKKCRDRFIKLKRGHGFDGFTPNFFEVVTANN